MKTIAAALLAFTLISGVAEARPATSHFADLGQTAPRSLFDDLNDSAPRSVFDDLRDSAPRSLFDDLNDSAPRSTGESSGSLDLTGE